MKNYYLLSLQSIKANFFRAQNYANFAKLPNSYSFFCIKIVFFTKKENEHHC